MLNMVCEFVFLLPFLQRFPRIAELKDGRKAGRWFSQLELHVLPKPGKIPVSEIDQRDIRDTLARFGTTIPIQPARP
ncbi:hypothetical protein C8N36_1192 [Pelagimonas varians]|uniref:Uncharacterized protein n=1 Tax=Pelagimonas varians TaxID=696760 RepID=A0A238L397_9RHOB|nr:hypothetical protein C8N36_1192 [Pelagimonas varians]SMX48806.1 hypothetical protein PEV8663_03957 [Pelagimonas varians]